jgi:hypothetical protein
MSRVGYLRREKGRARGIVGSDVVFRPILIKDIAQELMTQKEIAST